METVQTQVHGQPIVYQLDDTEVVLGKRRLALADVARVRLARFAEMWACELELRDGTRGTVISADAASRAPWARASRAAHRRAVSEPSEPSVPTTMSPMSPPSSSVVPGGRAGPVSSAAPARR